MAYLIGLRARSVVKQFFVSQVRDCTSYIGNTILTGKFAAEVARASALAKHDHIVAQPLNVFHVVTDQHDCRALISQRFDEFQNLSGFPDSKLRQ